MSSTWTQEEADIDTFTAKDEFIDPDPVVAKAKRREATERLAKGHSKWAAIAREDLAELD